MSTRGIVVRLGARCPRSVRHEPAVTVPEPWEDPLEMFNGTHICWFCVRYVKLRCRRVLSSLPSAFAHCRQRIWVPRRCFANKNTHKSHKFQYKSLSCRLASVYRIIEGIQWKSMVFDGFHYVKCVKMNFTSWHARFSNFKAFENVFFRRKLLVRSKFDSKFSFFVESAEISPLCSYYRTSYSNCTRGKSQYFQWKMKIYYQILDEPVTFVWKIRFQMLWSC